MHMLYNKLFPSFDKVCQSLHKEPMEGGQDGTTPIRLGLHDCDAESFECGTSATARHLGITRYNRSYMYLHVRLFSTVHWLVLLTATWMMHVI